MPTLPEDLDPSLATEYDEIDRAMGLHEEERVEPPAPPPPLPEPEGTICILTAEAGRFTRFWLSFAYLLALCGPVHLIVKFNLNIAQARNEAFREAKGKWVWFVDDDHTFEPYLLHKLLGRNVPIIQPLVLTRVAPFSPVVMGQATGDNKAHWKIALTPNLPKDGMKVEVIGAAGMLVRREVWEAIPDPWFEFGAIQSDVTSEDMIFCRKARAAGFEIWVDLEHTMSHMNVGEIWPVRQEDGSWITRVIIGNQAMDIPAATPKYKVAPDGRAYTMDGTEIPNAYDPARFTPGS